MVTRLIETNGNNDSSTGRFWSNDSTSLLAALMWLARVADKTMADVHQWAMGMDQPTDDDPGQVASLFRAISKNEDIDSELIEKVSTALRGVWASDSRMKSSYFVSVKAAVEPWSVDEVVRATDETTIDLDRLLSGNNTLFITSPLIDQQLLAPVIGGLVATIVDEAMLRNQKTGKRIDPELLILLDETAHIPLAHLPAWASTLTGLGIQLVTIWQSIAQIVHTFGENGNTVLDNSRSHIFFPGIKDPNTIRYVETLLGSEFRENRISSSDPMDRHGVSAGSLIPPNVLREMRLGDRLVVTSNTPPIHAKSTGGAR